jgi:hypothetical protein
VALRPEDLTKAQAAISRRDWMAGHPTAIGPTDEVTEYRAGLPTTDSGVPGIPRLHPDRYRGPGKPGTTPAGPNQPKPAYDFPTDL